jgi:hypothetical protein
MTHGFRIALAAIAGLVVGLCLAPPVRAQIEERQATAAEEDVLDGAARYNLYTGRLASVQSGLYDHGTQAPEPAACAAPVESAGGGRLRILQPPGQQASESVYYLVSAHVDDVESPTGHASDATEIDRSASICE